jgi:hypothetical protein
MIQATSRIPSWGNIRPAFMMNRTVYTGLMRLAMEKSTSALSLHQGMTQFGTPMVWMSCLGIPIRRCDAIINTEALVA